MAGTGADEPETPRLMTVTPHKYGKGSNPVLGWPQEFAVKAAEATGQCGLITSPDLTRTQARSFCTHSDGSQPPLNKVA
jgi:hypothetical protein